MKTKITLAFLLLFLCSCSSERMMSREMVLRADGFINIEVTDEHTDGDLSDDIKSIRFIVFTDLYSYPKAEVNEFHEITEANRASVLKAVLKVSRTEAGENDKLVVAIANEPTGLKTQLDNVSTVQQLEEIRLDMSSFVSTNHLSLLAGASMPMSGAAWTTADNVYETEQEAGEADNLVPLMLERAVARVEVYLTTDDPDGLQTTSGSAVTLGNTYTQSYFIRHENGANVLGRIQTVASAAMTSKAWTQTDATLNIPYRTPAVQGDPSSVHVCTFYTPERRNLTDRLRLNVGVKVSGDEGLKSGEIELTEAYDEHGTHHDVDDVLRNTRYRITVTIGAYGISAVVQDWYGEEVITEL